MRGSPKTVVKDPNEFGGRYLLGDPENAPVKMVMISDYQCPDCYRYEEQMMNILGQRSDVSLSVKHFPFDTECNQNVPSTKHGGGLHRRLRDGGGRHSRWKRRFWGVHKWMFEQKGTIREMSSSPRSPSRNRPHPVQSVDAVRGGEAVIEEDVEKWSISASTSRR